MIYEMKKWYKTWKWIKKYHSEIFQDGLAVNLRHSTNTTNHIFFCVGPVVYLNFDKNRLKSKGADGKNWTSCCSNMILDGILDGILMVPKCF